MKTVSFNNGCMRRWQQRRQPLQLLTQFYNQTASLINHYALISSSEMKNLTNKVSTHRSITDSKNKIVIKNLNIYSQSHHFSKINSFQGNIQSVDWYSALSIVTEEFWKTVTDLEWYILSKSMNPVLKFLTSNLKMLKFLICWFGIFLKKNKVYWLLWMPRVVS